MSPNSSSPVPICSLFSLTLHSSCPSALPSAVAPPASVETKPGEPLQVYRELGNRFIFQQKRKTMNSEEKEAAVGKRRVSCTKCFDALWFCYSPVYQLQQYYRLGVLDNCYGKWGDLMDCLRLKTKSASELEKILEDREKAQHHIWTFRSPEESRSYWNSVFGHLDEDKE